MASCADARPHRQATKTIIARSVAPFRHSVPDALSFTARDASGPRQRPAAERFVCGWHAALHPGSSLRPVLVRRVDKHGESKHSRTTMRTALRTAIAASIIGWSGVASACTLCHSEQAASVRARLLQADLAINACAVVLPLVALAWVIALVAHGPVAGGQTQ